MDAPELEAELGRAFIAFSVGKDHLEILLNSFERYFSIHMTYNIKLNL